MSGRRSAAAALLLALGIWAAAPHETAAEEEIPILLESPDRFRPARGEVEILATIPSGHEVERVIFFVDGREVGEVLEPPWRLRAELGSDNLEHTFQAVAHGAGGAIGVDTFSTPRLQVDDEISIRLQQLYVTVTRESERVLDLGPQDFRIVDDGRPQELVTFTRGEIPFTSVVLLDSSVSMTGEKLGAALAGARAFFDGMQPLDEGSLLVFSDRLLHVSPFTTFPSVLTAGLGAVTARGGTALNDYLYLALKQLEGRQGRRVVILLSDGVDSHSVLSMSEVLERARHGEALVYWLRLPYRAGTGDDDLPSLSTAWRGPEEYRHELRMLRRAVAESGGREQPLTGSGEIEAAFRGILTELREQYVLGYYPQPERVDGSWRRLRVEVGRPGLKVRTRDGYADY